MRMPHLFLLLATLACAPVDEPEPGAQVDDIVGGQRDQGRNPAVVALRIDGRSLCSGTLVGPRAVLTARHCVSETVARVSCPGRGPQVLRDLDARRIEVTNADDLRDGAPLARGTELVVPSSTMLCDADLAVLLLDRSLPGVSPLRLGDRLSPAVGDRVTVVGYGRRGDSARAGLGVRFRRAGVSVLADNETEFLTTTSGCEGDSGGPAIDPGSGRVVGVVSRGGPRCTGPEATVVFSRASQARALLTAARARPSW